MSVTAPPRLPLADAEAREAIRSALGETLVVEAAAGTGKTTELVHRITAVLAEGLARVDEIVAVTFTEKAAGELKLRLRSGLERARHDALGPRRDHLEQALAHLEEARVGTIHAFCADLLRERPVEAGLDPQFAVMTEPEAERLHGEAFERWLEQQLEDPPEGVRRSLRRRSSMGEGAASRLRKAAYQLAGFRDFPAPWRREPWARRGEIDALASELDAFCAMLEGPGKPGDNLYLDLEPARRLDASIRARAGGARDGGYHDEIEAELVWLARDWKFKSPRKGYGTMYKRGVTRAEVAGAHEGLAARVARFAVSADADLAALLRDELTAVTARYEAMKARTGKLDFVDLLVRARDLIRDDDTVRASFQRRFRRIFVDEFQDTDPLQAEILLLLASSDPAERAYRDATPEPGKLFIVGDPKQAIYRFRRADLAVYREVVSLVVARGGKHVHLSTSFRSVPSIQALVNAAFSPQMIEDPKALQASYVPLLPARQEALGQPSIIALPVPDPYGYRGVTARAVDDSLPKAVGAFVRWLVEESGFSVTERSRPDERVPVAARHVCLLFRRFEAYGEDVTRRYVQALEAHRVPHVLVGGKSFHDREEVETMTAALSAVEWPDDELSVFATLKGSLFAIGDEPLLEYRERFSRLDPLRVPEEPLDGALAPIGEALTLLRALHRQRNYRPLADTVSALLEATRAHAAFALRPSGPQALANVLHLADLGRQYEAIEGLSFRGFVERLRDEAGARAAPEAPILEEASDGVRLMTVHKAKGLEFPIVILADPTAKLAQGTASRFVEPSRGLAAMRLAGFSPWDLLDNEAGEVLREKAEGVRLAYVAATRARDLLVVPVVGDAPFPEGGWLSPLHDAIYPKREERQRAQKAPGCPAFGDDSVRKRPNGEEAPGSNVRPGLHTFPGGYEVVYWDPVTLDLDRPPLFGVPRHDLLAQKEVPNEVVEKDLAAYAAWRSARDKALAAASQPLVTVTTATARAADPGEPPPAKPVALIELPRALGRPAGPRFGTLVHAVLAAAPLDAESDVIAAVTRLEGRVLGATEEEIAAAAIAVETALGDRLFARAREAERRGECRRETPVLLVEAEGRIVEGVVDLAFREAGVWTVVDFKTDRDVTVDLPIYEKQVSLYARAVALSTGEPAVGLLLRV